MMDSLPSEKRKCHRCSFEKGCRELVLSGACERWTHIKGSDPQTGEPLNKWSCIDDLQHILLLEIGNQTSKASVEVNALRNEVAKAHSEQMTMASIAVQRSAAAVQDTFSKTLVDYLPPSRPTRLLESQ